MFISYYCCTEGALLQLQKFLQYIIVEFTPYIILLYLLSTHSSNSFKWSHFSIYIHMYTIFPPYSYTYTISSYSPHSYPLDRTCFAFMFSIFILKMTFLFVKDSYTGCFIMTVPCIYVL
jgi:hypothetical protein